MFLFFYNFILLSFSIFILSFFLLRLIFSKENIQSISEKFCLINKKRPKGEIIWINGVSIGEAKSGLTIANEILRISPNTTILFSTSTISAYKEIKKMNKQVILVFLPVDFNFLVKKFVNYWDPSFAFFMESEIWPNIIKELSRTKCKFIILNGRMSDKSFFWWIKFNLLTKEIFKQISFCATQDEISKERFKKLGTTNVRSAGNIKYLSSKLLVDNKKFIELEKKIKTKNIITFFSTHKNEEKILIECSKHLKNSFKDLFFIIVPRHMKNLNTIVKNLEIEDLSYSIRSKNNLKKNHNFYIANTFGELGLFFKLSKISIVGGSFNKTGGHNPIEVSHFNSAVIFGPNMQNFKEIKEKILTTKSGIQVKNSKELADKIAYFLKNETKRKKIIRNFKKLQILEAKKSSLLIQNIYRKL